VTAFADSSAVVKLYADERDRDVVLAREPFAISAIARVEVPAALWRKARAGALAATDAAVLVQEFEADYFGDGSSPPRFSPVAVSDEQLEHAARATAVHGLRAYDAVQLAAAVAVRGVDPTCSTFVAFDTDLSAAARIEGFELLP
jgi:predicted nucleic acid-binding protein